MHRCQTSGCGKVLVLDGNQKNNRPVCAAEHAEYTGLPGRVKTGCMCTPEQTSLFCALHKPRQMKPQCTGSSTNEAHRAVVETILRKKETRNTTHYEVCSSAVTFGVTHSHYLLCKSGIVVRKRAVCCYLGTC